ncbi:MAG: DNA-3-methyladenine glycosylase [bacterium]
MAKLLSSNFFAAPTCEVAPQLLGKYLVRKHQGKETAYQIIEVEAYDGFEDKASHASRGRTKRTKIMFGEPGRFYVYLIYGMYWMLNIVTGPKDYPAAILIRGLEGINGPGRLTKALKIDNKFNGKEASVENDLWFEDRGVIIPREEIKTSPRIGVAYAGEWAKKHYRFYLSSNPC